MPAHLTRPDLDPTNWHGLVTVAPEMHQLFERVRRAARTDASVLIRGESGTGKELVARALHDLSPRADRPFLAANCATFSGELLASELFGHKRGSFTGAVRDKPGMFQLADKGTVFLDEVAETSLDVQARLLRVVQEKAFVPLGGSRSVSVDVRIVSATHKGLRTLVETGAFREDLMYRIRVVLVRIPRLADRKGDIEALLWHFVDAFNTQGFRRVEAISHDAFEALLTYAWPGNVRELRNNVEAAFALGEGPVLHLDELAPEVQDGEAPQAPSLRPDTDPTTWKDAERQQILDALRATGGRRTEAAERLGISRTTLWRRLRELGIA